MAKQPRHNSGEKDGVYWGRLAVAFFAIIIAATHLASAIPLGSFSAPHTGGSGPGTGSAGSASGGPGSGYSAPAAAQLLPLWIDIEVITYTVIAVVYIFGMRSWYLPATTFNIFNLGLYLLSGLIAIPGITSGPFASHVSFSTLSVTSGLLIFSWFAVLVIGLLLLKHDQGSELDRLIHGKVREE